MVNQLSSVGEGVASAALPHALAVSAELSQASITLPNRSQTSKPAPKSFTGCVSEISSCATHDQPYAAALRNYAQVYEAYQAYLDPVDGQITHDYDAVGVAVTVEHQLGCLNEEMVDCTVHADDISDEDIDGCGYLGWIHHR